MFKRSHSVVVSSRNPWLEKIILAVLLLLLVLSSWFFFYQGRDQAGLDFEALNNRSAELTQQLDELRERNKRLSEQKAILERSQQIQKQGEKEVKTSLIELQDEILELKEEVAFYRSIVSPSESAKGLRIQSFEVTSNSTERSYRYKLVLTQVMKSNRVTSGKITMQLEGLQDSHQVLIPLNSLGSNKAKNLNFKFKYFQNFEDDILLPEGFIPLRVILNVTTAKVKLDKTFEWPSNDTTG
jgi:septal ring factor EnvC (AmiA/AmiB activator)